MTPWPTGRTRESGWSREEQSSVGDADRGAFAEGNAAYEERFGHVFLICASGLSGQQMLDQLRARLDNDEEAERAVVRDELRKITRLRMTKTLSS